MKMIWLSDLHLNFCNSATIDRLYGEINSRKPNYIVITGDITDHGNLNSTLIDLQNNLKSPVYFVLGNHDYYGGSIYQSRMTAFKTNWNQRQKPHKLIYLTESNPIELTSDTCLVGHDGPADGGSGELISYPLNDYKYIKDFKGSTSEEKKQILNQLGKEASLHFLYSLPKAVYRYKKIFIVVHAPPFAEACKYNGKPTSSEYLPHFCCHTVGEIVKIFAWLYPNVQLTVLCGHTHEETYQKIMPNLDVWVSGANYGYPKITKIFDIE